MERLTSVMKNVLAVTADAVLVRHCSTHRLRLLDRESGQLRRNVGSGTPSKGPRLPMIYVLSLVVPQAVKMSLLASIEAVVRYCGSTFSPLRPNCSNSHRICHGLRNAL